MKITVNALHQSTAKTLVYVLAGLALLLAAWLLFYDSLMYYLLQLFLEWAYLLRFVALFAAVFALLFLFEYIEKKFFGTLLQIEINSDHLQLITPRKTRKIPFDQLKWLTLTRKNEADTALDLQADEQLHFSLGTWFSRLKDPQFTQFWASLKKELKQKGFQYNQTSGKHNKLNVVKEMLCQDYPGYVKAQKRKKRKVIVFLIAYFALVIGVVLYLVPRFSNDGISIYNGEKIGASYFEEYQNRVYFLKVGEGYFPLPEAEPASFKALEIGQEVYSSVGADRKNVYWQDRKLQALNPATSTYLGGDYIKDTRQVYFRDQRLNNADVASFQSVKHSQYNTTVYYFGKDRNSVFYQTTPLLGLQAASAHSFDNSARYIKDQQIVFYKSTHLQGLNAAKTIVYDSDKHRTAYATDGLHHYLNAAPIPQKASNKYWGNTTIDQKSLTLLIPSGEGSYLSLFGDNQHLYFYDEDRRKMVMVYKFEQQVILKPLENGRFTDGRYIYTIANRKIRTRSRTITTTHGYQMKVLRLASSPEQNPQKVASFVSPIIEGEQ